jgi:Cu-Zn family superoxide dismutase
MKKFSFIFFLAVMALATACNNNGDSDRDDADTMDHAQDTNVNTDTASMPMQATAQAILAETVADTVVTGKAVFDTANGKVKMTLELTIPKMANKAVAVHIHEHGDCGDKAMMAHGHWNPRNQKHGKWGEGEFHAGDIGNVNLDSKGAGKMELETDLWTLGGSSQTNILKKALIVHSGKDDYSTQPTGNAGSRIGCGVIQ